MGLVDSFMRRYRSMSPWLIVLTFAALILSQQRSSSSSSSSPTCSKKKGLSHGSTALTSPRNPALASRAHSENCHQGPMKLAIYQGRWYHSEVFGTFIDHANECGHTLTIYYEDGHATSAVPLYIQLYADKFVVRNPSHFLAEQHEYDAVIFTTPDDIPDEGLQKRNAHRFIYTIHLLEPAYAKNWHLLRIHMSTVVSWPFVVPVYDGGDKIAPAATRKKEIMMLGACLCVFVCMGCFEGRIFAFTPLSVLSALLPYLLSLCSPSFFLSHTIHTFCASHPLQTGTLWDGENYDIAQVYKLAELLEPHGWTLVAYTRHWGSAKGKVADPPKNMRLEMSKGTVEVRGVGKFLKVLCSSPLFVYFLPLFHPLPFPHPSGV